MNDGIATFSHGYGLFPRARLLPVVRGRAGYGRVVMIGYRNGDSVP